MDEKLKTDYLKKRMERLGEVIPTTITPTVFRKEDAADENSPKEWKKRTCWHIWVNPEDREFLERYIYWRSCAMKRKVTYSDAITDAVKSLKKHCPIEVKPIPDWVPRRKKTEKRNTIKEKKED